MQWDFCLIEQVKVLYQHCKSVKASVHRDIHIACVQKLILETSHQDFCNFMMSMQSSKHS